MRPRISIITPVKNAESTIGQLYASLGRQTFKDFEWIVMDGQSTDGTRELLEKFSQESTWLHARSQPDCGLYDAINKGIGLSNADFYVVAGADDEFYPNAVADYMSALEANQDADVVLARVCRAGVVIGGFSPARAWIGHSKAFKGSHSLGMLFKKSLHEKFGTYSNRFRLLADGYFLKQLLRDENIRFIDALFTAGEFSTGGLSSNLKMQTLVETWQIQMLTEKQWFLQTCMFVGKLVVRYPSIVKELQRSK